jgi:hypothetical protein
MEPRTSLGRSALLSGAVCMTRLRVCIAWAWHERSMDSSGTCLISVPGVSLHSTRTESCVARYSGTTL